MAFISWWYGKGLAWRAGRILSSIERSIDNFSLGILIRTLFSPFKQIDALGGSGGSFKDRFDRWFGKQFSRIFGAFLRLILMFVGIFWIFIQAVLGLFNLLIWVLMPILPAIFVILFLTGWTPNILPAIKSNLNKLNKPATTKTRSQK